jgi:predicted transcriptional regulator of viral defense system
MQFYDFKNTLNKFEVFSMRDIENLIPQFNKKNLNNWQKKRYVVKLRNSLYCFLDISLDQEMLFYIANKIYKPSYISLESALWYYSYIPEAVFQVTSISTLKTNKFENKFGDFIYKSIKKRVFFGYKIIVVNGKRYKIAEPEKAIIDYLHINTNIKSQEDFSALRFNKLNIQSDVDFEKMEQYATVFESKILTKKIMELKRFVNA